MRIRNFVIAVAVLALAVPGLASAQRPHESGFKVTGGGQTTPSDEYQGPGDTFGFNARATGEADEDGIYPANGQFNHIDREESQPGDEGRGQGEHYKGVVECLKSTGPNSAQFGGRLTNKTDDGEPIFFVVDVVDNGQGGNDVIYYREYDEDGDNPCDNDDEVPENPILSRGNLTIHNNPEGGGDEA